MSSLIANEDILVFDFPLEDFIIYFDKGVWYLKHNNEDIYDSEVILEDLKNGIKFEEDIVVFDTNYLLTKQHFDKLKSFS
jgi:hypothetical protein